MLIFFILSDIYFSDIILNSLRFNLCKNSFCNLVYVKNTGAAFSLFENFETFLIAFSILAIIFLMVYTIKNLAKISCISVFFITILLAGISCNLYERLAFGYVRDFFSLSFINFPIFNISDVFINIGVIALIIIITKNKYLKK